MKEAAATGQLLERSEEMARIESALAEARSGRGTFVVLEGPAGIGKTALLAAARTAAAESGMRVLRSRGTELERVVGLELGADDYVVKPFSGAEVIARMRAVLRRVRPVEAPASELEVGPVRIEVGSERPRIQILLIPAPSQRGYGEDRDHAKCRRRHRARKRLPGPTRTDDQQSAQHRIQRSGQRNGTLYVGVTSDLLKRVQEHREGLVPGFTRRYGVKTLVYWSSITISTRRSCARSGSSVGNGGGNSS